MVIRFYCIHQSYKKKIAPSRDLLSGHPLQKAIEVIHTTSDEKDPFLFHAWNFLYVRTPQNGAIGVTGLTMASIVVSKFLHCTILVTISAKSFFQQNFNLTPKRSRVLLRSPV